MVLSPPRKYEGHLSLIEILRMHHSVSDDCAEAIEKAAHYETYEKKSVIVRQDKECDSFYFISSGVVRISFTRGNKEDTICFGGDGDVFMSFHSVWGGMPSAFSLVAVTDVELYRVSHGKLAWLREEFPELNRYMCNLLFEQLYALEVLYKKLAIQTPEERMMNFWDLKANRLRTLPPNILSRMVPLRLIAQYMGMTPQTLSKLRRKLVGK